MRISICLHTSQNRREIGRIYQYYSHFAVTPSAGEGAMLVRDGVWCGERTTTGDSKPEAHVFQELEPIRTESRNFSLLQVFWARERKCFPAGWHPTMSIRYSPRRNVSRHDLEGSTIFFRKFLALFGVYIDRPWRLSRRWPGSRRRFKERSLDVTVGIVQ